MKVFTKIFTLQLFLFCVIFAANAQPNQRSITSPEILPDNRVTINLLAPQADNVKLLGGWMANSFMGEDMTKQSDGVWTYTTTEPLKEDLYRYSFLVDGVKTLDPSNIKQLRDNSNYFSYFILPGELSNNYKMNDVPHGTVSNIWYDSPVLEMNHRRMYVYTPVGYEKSTKRYPVLYLLHGVFSDEEGWISIGRAVNILDNLIALGKAEPMIMVMTNGNFFQHASPNDVTPEKVNIMEGIYKYAGKFEESLVKDIVPFVDSNFRTLANSENRAIAGFSMGGGQATYTALTYPDLFAWVGSFSGAFVVWPNVRPAPDVNDIDLNALENKVFPNLDASINSKLKLLYLTIGTLDPLLDPQHKVRNWFREKGIQFEDIETEGYAHVWGYWRMNLVDFTTKIFK